MHATDVSRFLLVCVGGAVGTGARFLVSSYARDVLGPAFAWGTLAVNLVGSFLLGVLMELGLTTGLVSPTARVVLATGVLGGFTTYSSFNYETLRYAQDGAWPRAIGYVAATLVGCFAAGIAGVVLARRIAGA